MINLKLSKKEQKLTGVPEEVSENEYPWGTTLRFEDDQIKKLHLENAEVDDVVSIRGIGKIISAETSKRNKEKEHRSIEIQVQEVEIITGTEKIRKEIAGEVFKN